MSNKNSKKLDVKKSEGIYENDNKISISFIFNFTFRSTKYHDFTNYYKDDEELKNKLDFILNTLFVKFSSLTFKEILTDKRYHAHFLKRSDSNSMEKINKIIKILRNENKEIGGEDIKKNAIIINRLEKEDIDIYQAGLQAKSEIRIYFIKEANIIKIILIDLYHLIYENKKFNLDDYKNFKNSLNRGN